MRNTTITVLIEQKETASNDRVELLRTQVSQVGYTAEVLYRRSNMDVLDRVAQAAAVGPVVLIDSSLITTQSMMTVLLEKPWTTSSALVARHPAPAFDMAVRVSHGQVVSAATELHRVSGPTHASMGLLRVAPTREAIRALLDAKPYVQSLMSKMDGVGLLTLLLVRANIPVMAVEPTGPCSRVGGESSDDIVTIAHSEDDDIKLARAGKTDDGFFTTFVVRRMATPVVRLALRKGWRTGQATLASLGIGVLAALSFSGGTPSGLAVGAFLALGALILERVDGDIARYTDSVTVRGRWLDAMASRLREYTAYIGLAAGAAHHSHNLWGLAMALAAMQTARFLVDSNFSAVAAIRETTDLSMPLAQLVDLPSIGPSRLLDRDEALESRPVTRWVKRVFELHPGERWLVIIIGAATGHVRLVLALLYVWGLLALLYVLLRGCLRSSAWRRDDLHRSCDVVERQVDVGPVLATWTRRRPHYATSRYAWSLPAVLAGGELAAVAAVGNGHVWAALWLVAVAVHHVDLGLRAAEGAPFPASNVAMGLGVETRLALLLAGAVALPGDVLFFAGGWYFALVFLMAPVLSLRAAAQRGKPRRQTIR